MASKEAAAKRLKTEQSSLTSFFKSSSSNTQKEKSDEEKKAEITDDKVDTNNDTTAPSDEPGQAIVPSQVPVPRHTSWKVHQESCIYRCLHDEAPRSKVAAFDLEGTLLEWRVAAWPSRFEHYELWNSTVISKLQALYQEGFKLLIVSNQGTIREDFEGKTATFVKTLLNWLAHSISRPVHVVMSTKSKGNSHKPSPAMWKVAEQFCNQGQEFDLGESFYVGDSDDPQGGVDLLFAKNVGSLKFYTPEEYFGPSHKQLRFKLKGLGPYEAPSTKVLETRAALASGYLSGPLLLILCGVQGSGKSTFCQHLIQCNDKWVHLSQDTVRDGKPGKRKDVELAAKEALVDGKCVVIDRMHLDETQREHFIQIAESARVPAHAVVLSPPADVVIKRVRERTGHPGGVQRDSGANIAAASVDKMSIPKYAEGLDLVSASSTVEGAAKLVELYANVPSSCVTTIPSSFSLGGNVQMPSIALGTMGLRRKKATNVVSKAVRLGFGAFDTAPSYKNEDKVGASLGSCSFCIVKVPKRALGPKQVRSELSKSFSQLQKEHADLLLLHWPSDVISAGTLKEVWKEMEKCQQEGLAGAIGVCNFNVEALRMLLLHCTIPPAVNQVERHPLNPQWELVDFCAKHDILLQAHTPLGQGKALTHSTVEEIATTTGKVAAQIVLQWNLQQGVAVIPKCSLDEHMNQVLESRTSESLSHEHMKALNNVSDRKRFVEPPFMFGPEPYCWGPHAPK